MYKEIWISVLIIILIISLNFFIEIYMDAKLDYIVSLLDEMESEVRENRYNDAMETSKKIDKYWGENKKVLSCYIEHDELEKVETEFTSLDSYINMNKDEASEFLERMRFVIKHIEKKDDFVIENIL